MNVKSTGMLLWNPKRLADKLMSEITGLTEKTIRQGRKEVEKGLSSYPVERNRAKGSGRFLTEKKYPRPKRRE